jgi:hypothetical protein
MSPLSAFTKMIVLVMLGLGLTLGVIWTLSPATPVQASSAHGPALRPRTAGIVTVCNEASLRATLAGGGTVTFNCSGIITVTSSLLITAPTMIDGSGQSVTLSGGNAVRIIDTTSGVGTLSMQNITLTLGKPAGASQDGGAVYERGNLVLTNVTMIGNSASGNGGGAYVTGALTSTGAQFVNNSASNGGGAWVRDVARLNGGLFQLNRVDGISGGGGLYAFATLSLTGTRFISNTGNMSAGGAGVYATNAVTAIGALFRFNRAGGKGGGLYAGSAATLTATQFIDNEAHDGGGIYHATGVLRVTNALFARNRAPAFGTGADLVLASAGSVQILHTTMADTGLTAREGLYVVAGTVGITDTIVVSHAIGIRQTGGVVYADHNLFYNNTISKTGTIGGGSNDVNGDPVFVDPANDDYHLGADSAAIDTGIGVSVTTDFDGDTRPQGLGIDIGYDEVLQRCLLSPNADYAFSIPAVTLNFSAMGNVNCAAAVYFPRAAPYATGTVGHGVGADHFWQIAARDATGQPATNFTASITVPHSGFTSPLLCFYPGALGGAGWDCTGAQTYDAGTVTRQGITHFSDWAVGNDVGPTAVTLHSISARFNNHSTSVLAVLLIALGLVGAFLMWRRSHQPVRIK